MSTEEIVQRTRLLDSEIKVARPGREPAGSLRRPERGGERAPAAEGGMRGRGGPGEPGTAPLEPSLAPQPPARVGGPVSPQPGLSAPLL